MKTVIIPIFQSFLARSILRTEAFTRLAADKNIRIVILAPDFKEEYYRDEFGAENVFIEGIDNNILRVFSTTAMHKISVLLLPTYFVRYTIRYKKLSLYIASVFINYIIAPVGAFRRIFRFVDSNMMDTSLFDGYFEKYKPDLVFSTDIFNPSDANLLLVAKRNRIKTVGMVRSWDCTTNKNFLRIVPDVIISNNEQIKRELIKFHSLNISDDNVIPVGFSQYDDYMKLKPKPRVEFLKSINVDISKRLILFAPGGNALTDIDWQYAKILKEALNNGQLPDDIHILIRNHPQDQADFSKAGLDSYFSVDKPGVNIGGGLRATEVDKKSVEHAFNSVYHCQLLISVNTSFGLDAVVLDKPHIMLGFDGYEKKDLLQSVARYHEEDNMKAFIKTGAVKIVKSPEQLVQYVNKYLNNPAEGEDGREKARDEIMFAIDGKAGDRIADILLKQLN